MTASTPASQAKSRIGAICVAMLVGYWCLLAAATHWPLPPPSVGSGVPHIDKLEHLAGYFVLGSLLGVCVALRYGAVPRYLLIAWGVILGYAAIEEVTQIPFNRQCDVYDWLADAVGSGTALTLVGVVGWLIGRRTTLEQTG